MQTLTDDARLLGINTDAIELKNLTCVHIDEALKQTKIRFHPDKFVGAKASMLKQNKEMMSRVEHAHSRLNKHIIGAEKQLRLADANAPSSPHPLLQAVFQMDWP